MTEPDRDPVLVVTELTKTYGGRKPVTAVDRLSFALGRGEILGLLGPNGAGKTTTIQMLMSTLTPTSGRIAYFGRSLETDREAILERVGFASAYSKLPLHLKIDENLDVFGRLYGLPAADRKARARALLERFGVWDLRKRTMAGLSAGQTTRVMLAKAFLARPRIVLLDEPTASLDPDIAHEVREFVCEARDHDGVSILYTSHNMDEVAQICDRVLFLDKGKIAAVGRPDELAASAAATRITFRVDRGLDHLLRHAAERGLATQVETARSTSRSTSTMSPSSSRPSPAPTSATPRSTSTSRPSRTTSSSSPAGPVSDGNGAGEGAAEPDAEASGLSRRAADDGRGRGTSPDEAAPDQCRHHAAPLPVPSDARAVVGVDLLAGARPHRLGLTSRWVESSGNEVPQLALILLTGVVFWQVVWRANYEISVNLLEEFWNQNMVNLFATPLTVWEWSVGLVFLGPAQERADAPGGGRGRLAALPAEHLRGRLDDPAVPLLAPDLRLVHGLRRLGGDHLLRPPAPEPGLDGRLRPGPLQRGVLPRRDPAAVGPDHLGRPPHDLHLRRHAEDPPRRPHAPVRPAISFGLNILYLTLSILFFAWMFDRSRNRGLGRLD